MFIVVSGGSGSGKSAFAEDQVMSFGDKKRYYIATMHPYDQESFARIERHHRLRAGKGFETIECYTSLKEVKVAKGSTVLLECMSNLAANEMFEDCGAKEKTVDEIIRGIASLLEQAENLVVVTNEIFSDTPLFQGDMQRYQAYLGTINQKMAAMADEVVEVIYGIPIYNKRSQ